MLRSVLYNAVRNPRAYRRPATISLYRSAHRRNYVGIQLIPDDLQEKLFQQKSEDAPSQKALQMVQRHLEKFDLWDRRPTPLAEVQVDIPGLQGNDVEEHFEQIGEKYVDAYKGAIEELLNSEMPNIPEEIALQQGWVRYEHNGEAVPVKAPEGSAIIFDVETVVKEGGLPAMAAALSSTHWYSWCSTALVKGKNHRVDTVTPDSLIPLGSGDVEQVVIGHNVGFDRSFVKEEYDTRLTKRRFLDTLSMHVCVSGLTSMQRTQYLKYKKAEQSKKKDNEQEENEGKNEQSKKKDNEQEEKNWIDVSSMNSLADVYQLYCDKTLSKSARKVFEEGSTNDVQEHFQELMEYCMKDVKATRDVLKELYPLFLERLPHPVTLFGMMEMLTAYLPVNQNWTRYMNQTEAVYNDVNTEIKLILNAIANRVCRANQNEEWRNDPWLWDLDWEVRNIKPKNASTGFLDEGLTRRPFMSGYPKWYRDLCMAKPRDRAEISDWEFGAWNVSTQMRCVPKLMKLLWNGYPLHHSDKHGWGYLVPAEMENETVLTETTQEAPSTDDSNKGKDVSASDALKTEFPLDEYMKIIETTRAKYTNTNNHHNEDSEGGINLTGDDATEQMKKEFALNTDIQGIGVYDDSKKFSGSKGRQSKKKNEFLDIGIRGVLFKKLPHKNGPNYNVGNPLSKDFISQFEGNVLTSWNDDNANTLLKLSKQATYWKNFRDRLNQQMVVWINDKQGVILPRLLPAGTISRRAVEKTWLTASNAKKDRIGSELKAMIQAPSGMHFVGADVDSQELWIASLLGDAKFGKMHGCTALGWMTLQGSKAEGTDMHSRTAETAGCSRDHAKVLNYARIYGAGQRFAATLLRRFNPRLTEKEAAASAKKMFVSTKGVRTENGDWEGGSESHMFNELEKMATTAETKTPVLGAQITRALQSKYVGSGQMMSRINWVVQSSAVDYLHLMLVSMRHLAEENEVRERLVVSIHDEVRFMVPSEQRYEATYALHITNLLVRALFAKKVGINNLPFGVAFFSAVDVDLVIRKDVRDDSVTPSNPHGLYKNYGIPHGEELDIYKAIELSSECKRGKKRAQRIAK